MQTGLGEIIREVKRLAEYGKMIQNGVQQVQIARATVDAFTNIRDLGSAVSAFGMVGVQNPVPELNVYALQGLLSGTGGAQGMVGNLGGLYAGTPLDTQTSYVRDFLRFLGMDDVEFVYAEGLAMGDASKEEALARAGRAIETLVAKPHATVALAA